MLGTLLSVVNLFGINIMAYLNNISTIGKLIPMAVFVIGGLNIAGSFNTPRCAHALADGGLLPESFGKCNQHHAPYIAVIATGALVVVAPLYFVMKARKTR